MARRAGDRYLTPDSAVRCLLDRDGEIRGKLLLDPCSGDGRMAALLAPRFTHVITNDIAEDCPADLNGDARDPGLWSPPCVEGDPRPSWCVTNPPFSLAGPILQLALQHCTRGVALLLRCTFLEAVAYERRKVKGLGREWLAETPPSRLICLPRVSFTGQGSDSAAAWWMIWQRGGLRDPKTGLRKWQPSEDLQILTKAQLRAYEVES